MIPFVHTTSKNNCLYPLAAAMATPLLPIVNRPIMAYTVELLARYGYREIFVSLHHMTDHIEQQLGNGERWNVQLSYLLQRHSLPISSVLAHVADQLTETCLIIPADILVDFDIEAALAFHHAQGSEATVLLFPNKEAAKQMSTRASKEQQQLVLPATTAADEVANTQIYLLEPSALTKLQLSESHSEEAPLLTALLASGITVQGHVMDGYWNPLGSFAELQAAQQAVMQQVLGTANRAPNRTLGESSEESQDDSSDDSQDDSSDDSQDDSSDVKRFIHELYAEGRQIAPGIWCGAATTIHPSVQLTAPVYIGQRCRIGRGVELGPGTIIGDNCMIDDNATIVQSTVMADTYVGQLTDLAERIVHQGLLIDSKTGEHVQITDPVLLGAVDVKTVDTIMWNAIERILAFIGFGLALPLILLCGSLLWLTEGGAIFTRVNRVGRKPKSLKLWSMNEPQLITLFHLRTRRADGSQSWFGAWLERTEIARLPELWHVVRHEIGLVGVKPLPREMAMLIVEPWQQKRYEFQAGFTGLWYTETAPDCDPYDLCLVDTYHATTHHWRIALRALRQTPRAWLWRMRYHHAQRTGIRHTPQLLRNKVARLMNVELRSYPEIGRGPGGTENFRIDINSNGTAR